MASLKDKYAIVGVGHSALGKVPELSDYGLQVTAVKAALDDAGLKKTDVDAVITHSHLLGAVRECITRCFPSGWASIRPSACRCPPAGRLPA